MDLKDHMDHTAHQDLGTQDPILRYLYFHLSLQLSLHYQTYLYCLNVQMVLQWTYQSLFQTSHLQELSMEHHHQYHPLQISLCRQFLGYRSRCEYEFHQKLLQLFYQSFLFQCQYLYRHHTKSLLICQQYLTHQYHQEQEDHICTVIACKDQ